MYRMRHLFLVLSLSYLLVGCNLLPVNNRTEIVEDPVQASQYYSLALNATQGIGEEQNYSKGVSLFRQSAEYGSDEGAYMVGMSYLTGRGVRSSNSEAAYWLELAAKKGHVRALYQLSVLYMNGRGVEQDKTWAAFLLNRAADLGHKQAAFDTGISYAMALGVDRQPAAAWYWFSVARKKGVDNASRLQSRMLLLTNQDQRNKAVRLMRYRGKVDRATTQFIQQKLTKIGYEPGTVDGIWGQKTAIAFKRFTQNELLLSDLEPDWETLKLLKEY